MLFRVVLIAAYSLALLAGIALPLRLAAKSRIEPQMLSGIRVGLLWIAGMLSGLMAIFALAAAAWGMDTRLKWGLGVYPYLIPVLSLPGFLLLRISPPRVLARVLWFLTAACGVAWYFGDRADRISSGLPLISDPLENLGMFLNAFTLLFIAISLLVHMAAISWRRQKASDSVLTQTGMS